MKITKERPSEGQFVAAWEFDGEVWAATYRWNSRGYLECFNAEADDFETGSDTPANVDITYIIGD